MAELKEYRRRPHSDVWHWRSDCRWWPVAGYAVDIATRRPHRGEACNECKAKDKRERRGARQAYRLFYSAVQKRARVSDDSVRELAKKLRAP